MTDDMNDPRGISRRDALKMLGAVPLTGALHWTSTDVTRALHALSRDATAAAPVKLKFFTPHEFATMSTLVDIIIPRDDISGSATDAKVPEFMDYMLAEASERTQTEMHGGIAWLDNESRHRFGTDFVSAAPAQRTAIIDDIAWPKKAAPEMSHGVVFFNSVRDMTASGFFSSQMGHEDVHFMGNVFNPNWNGCPPEALRKLGVSYEAYDRSRGNRAS